MNSIFSQQITQNPIKGVNTDIDSSTNLEAPATVVGLIFHRKPSLQIISGKLRYLRKISLKTKNLGHNFVIICFH